MTEIRWEAPSTKFAAGRPASTKWAVIAQELEENIGEWAVVAEDVSSTTAYLIRAGKLKAFSPAGAYESVSRGNEKGKAKLIYARYVGMSA